VTEASASHRGFFGRLRPATLAGGLLFVTGAVAGVAVHPAFLLVAALGASGPQHRAGGRYLAVLPVVLFLLLPLALTGVGLLRVRPGREEP
jgi:hypothetical protein